MNRRSGAVIEMRHAPASAPGLRGPALPATVLPAAQFVAQVAACADTFVEPTTLALFGIDGGTGAGAHSAAVLAEVERATLAAMRGTDILGVFGRMGDEIATGAAFGILFTDTGLQEAVIATERLRSALARLCFATAPDLRITVSFGLSGLDRPGAGPALRQAGAALAEARRRGGNRCLLLQQLF